MITHEIKDFAKLVNKCMLAEQSMFAAELERKGSQLERKEYMIW